MKTETIEQKTYRLMMHVYGESLLSEERAVKSKNFRYFCQLVELAIAEEREANVKICERIYNKANTPLSKDALICAMTIRERSAPKDEVSE